MSVLFVRDSMNTKYGEHEEMRDVYALQAQVSRGYENLDEEGGIARPKTFAIQIRQSVEVETDVEVVDLRAKDSIPDLRGQSAWS